MLVDDVECTELTIESILGTALLEFFDAVVIENVTDLSSQKTTTRMKSVSSPEKETQGDEQLTELKGDHARWCQGFASELLYS